jgi:predicted SAM-dependent methyltransferase
LNNKTILEKALKKAVPKQDGQGKKLNLGCGAKTIQGYENVDVYKASYIDAVYDLCEIPYNDSTISEIHSEHALEHVGYELGKKAIKEWFRVLKPGGILDLKIPDIEACASAYLRTTNNEMVNGFPAKLWYLYTIYGIQKSQAGEADEFQCHRWGYSKESISALLTEVGFRNISVIHYDGWGTLSLHVTARKFRETIKIGWIAPINWEAVQTRVRVLNINQWLYSKGYESNVVNYPEIISQNYDVAVVGKCFDIHHYQNIKLLKQHRKTVFCDLCEDILEFPYVKEIIKICDKIICCSHVLEEKVKKINLNTVVIEDAYEK